MSIIQAPAREREIDAEDKYMAALTLLIAESGWVWRMACAG